MLASLKYSFVWKFSYLSLIICLAVRISALLLKYFYSILSILIEFLAFNYSSSSLFISPIALHL